MAFKDPEKRKQYIKKYYEKNREKLLEYHRKYDADRKIKRREKYQRNKDERCKKQKEYYYKNREYILKYNKEYRNKHKEHLKEYQDQYNIKNKEAIRTKQLEYEILHKKPIICIQCGKESYAHRSTAGKFCSHACSSEWHRGENHPNWNGGISYEPYCPKFNENLKNRIRAYFGHRCIVCGRHQNDNNGCKLSCHHVEYNKQACCDGKPVQFAALCQQCHGRTSHDRERWEPILHIIIDEIYDSRSYYTNEEYRNIISDGEK